MSLILEALRKSEAERRRGETPGVHSELPSATYPARRGRLPVIAWGVGAIALLLALWGGRALLLRDTHDAPTPHAPVARSARVAPAHPPAPLPAVPHLTPPVATPSTMVKVTPPANATPATEPSGQAPQPLAPPTAPIAGAETLHDGAAARTPDDGTLRLSDLAPDERKALPPLKLSMHMWNDDPSRRFVILDGNRLREGDRIGDAVVTAITTDGVVLDWNGRKLKLPIR